MQITLLRKEINPSSRPKAKKCPSDDQEQPLILAETLCLITDSCSGDHIPKSVQVQLTNWLVTGLNCKHFMP